MNEKIKQLLTQAIYDVDYIRDDDALNEDLSQMFIPDCFAERFAELIVMEVESVCEQFAKERDDRLMGISHDPTEQIIARKMGKLIMEHFGVEE
jgi:hypothetical protein